MIQQVTEEIAVAVEFGFQPDYSVPHTAEYLFAYQITIENRSPYAVQLLRRHWYILDSNGEETQVEGEGVVGETPIIKPDCSHQYVSMCNFKTDIGMMKGKYKMLRLFDQKLFEVEIPPFTMVVPYRLN